MASTKYITYFSSYIFVILFAFFPQFVLAFTPNDPLFESQWYLRSIHAPEAWDLVAPTHTPVVVAVLDAGVALDHPDLVEHLWTNDDEIPFDGKDNDLNGYIDDVRGWDFVDGDADPSPHNSPEDDPSAVSHGTAIAGLIGAVGNNAEGMAGVAMDVRIMSVRILDGEGAGNSEHARQAIRYAVRNGARIINMSSVGDGGDFALSHMIDDLSKQGVLFVTSLGNNGRDGGTNLNEHPLFPACFQTLATNTVMGVSAINQAGKRSSFSNYGSHCADIAAPGEGIAGLGVSGYTSGWQGTSFSTPLVAGAAALVWSSYPSLSASQVDAVLRLSVDPMVSSGDGTDVHMGAGRLNVYRAMQIAPQFAQKARDLPRVTKRPLIVTTVGSSRVDVYEALGEKAVTSFEAYETVYPGGVRAAVGDVDHDGELEIVTVPGKGGNSDVRVFSMSGVRESRTMAFESDLKTGYFLAVGDVDGEGADEVVVSEDEGGKGRVRVLSKEKGLIADIDAFQKNVRGVRVAVGNVDADQADEIVVGTGAGEVSRVAVFKLNGMILTSLPPYGENDRRGVFVTTGDLNDDGVEEVYVSPGAGGVPEVKMLTGGGVLKGTFLVYAPTFTGEVHVAAGDFGGRHPVLVTIPGTGGGSHVRVFNRFFKEVSAWFPYGKIETTGWYANL